MDSLQIKAVLDYDTYVKLRKYEKDNLNIAAETINKDLGLENAKPFEGNAATAVSYDTPETQLRFESGSGTGPGDKIYNEHLVKNTEPEQGSDSDNEESKIHRENDTIQKDENEIGDPDNLDDSNFKFLSRMPMSSGNEKKATRLIELLGLDPKEKIHIVDNVHYTDDELKNIFYQLYIKKSTNYKESTKLLSFLKSIADRKMFNLIKNKSLLAGFKKAWYLL